MVHNNTISRIKSNLDSIILKNSKCLTMGATELEFQNILDMEHEHIKDLMLLLKQFYYDFNDKMNELLTLGKSHSYEQ